MKQNDANGNCRKVEQYLAKMYSKTNNWRKCYQAKWRIISITTRNSLHVADSWYQIKHTNWDRAEDRTLIAIVD